MLSVKKRIILVGSIVAIKGGRNNNPLECVSTKDTEKQTCLLERQQNGDEKSAPLLSR